MTYNTRPMQNNKWTLAWICLALTLYLFFSLTYLTLPGLQYDETNFVNAAMGRTDAGFCDWAPKLFGRRVPLMVMSYIGAVKSALYAPIFKIFGANATTIRLPVVIIGFFTLLFSYALFRQMFDRRIATASLLLFATDPTFIFGNKLDWGPVSLLLFLELASLYFMWRWMKEGKRHFLAIAGLLLGLGLYNKIIFAWFLAALFISLLFFFRENLKQLLRLRNLKCFLPAFILGGLPLIAFNIIVPMGTFKDRPALSSFEIGTLRHRYYLFRGTLDGSGVYSFVNREDVADRAAIQTKDISGKEDLVISKIASISWIGKSPLDLVLAGSLVLVLIFMISGRLRNQRSILFLCANLLIIALLICLTSEATGGHHVLSFYPFVFIVVGYAACEIGTLLTNSRPQASAIIAGAVLLPLLFIQVVLDARHLQSFRAIGGAGVWSDAIYDLAAYARQNSDRRFVLMEWGLGTQFPFLTNAGVRYEEPSCGGSNTPDSCLESLAAQRDSLLVFYAPPFGDKALLEAYNNVVERNHLYAHLRKTFFQRNGHPVYLVYETVHQAQEQTKTGVRCTREAEDFNAKEGGGLDYKAAASRGIALGNFWGQRSVDFAFYTFSLAGPIPNALFRLRYAFELPSEQQYLLFLDGAYVTTISLLSTHGFGYAPEEWKVFETRLGYLKGGVHELKIRPAHRDQTVNLDWWEIRD